MNRSRSTDDKKDAVDNVTNAMYALDFLKSFTDAVIDPKLQEQSVNYFYSYWLGTTGQSEIKIPFNPGAVLGFLYVGILYTKEIWFELIPEISMPKSQDWGTSRVIVDNPKNPNIKLNQFARRLRNSLAHGNVKILVPTDGSITPENILEVVSYRFNDVNQYDQTDTFEVTLSITELVQFIKKFQNVIHKSAR